MPFRRCCFGFAASGQDTAHLVEQSSREPAWLSGGAFGPEGSVVVIPVIGLALLLISHSLAFMSLMVDFMLVICEGRIVESGPRQIAIEGAPPLLELARCDHTLPNRRR